MSGGTLLFGPTGSGKTYTAVKDFVLPQLRAKRRVTTNITGLNPGAIAVYLGQTEATVRKNLNVIEDERIGPAGGPADDRLWANDANTGWVQHGDLLVLDEAWQWLQYIKQISPAADHFLRRHRKFKGGFPARSTEYVLLTQTAGDLHEKILAMCNRKVGFVKLEGTGRQDIYTRGDYQAGNLKAPPIQTTDRYEERIFPLYQSYNGEIGAAEEPERILDQRQVIWKSRSAIIGMSFVVCAALLAATAGRAYFFPHNARAATVEPFATSGLKSRVSPSPVSATQASAPAPMANGFSLPIGPDQAVSPPPHGPQVNGGSSPASSFVVLPLKGDPSSVQRVVDAFCAVSECKAVVEPGTQQVVLVGTDKVIADARRLISSLGARPPASLVQLVIFESDDSVRSDTGWFIDAGGGWGSLSAGSAIGGITARVTAGQFTAGLAALRGRGLARVVSAPVLAIYPGEHASVTAGLQVPVLSQIVMNPQGQTTSGVEYRDSGVLVSLEQVSAGPRPVMKVSVEVSDFQATEIGVKGNPSKSQRALTTSVEVPPCEAVILGGMTRETLARQEERVPLLNLPITKTSRGQHSRLFVALLARPASGSDAACAAPEPGEGAAAAPGGRG